MSNDNDILKPLSTDKEQPEKGETSKPLSLDRRESEKGETSKPLSLDRRESEKRETSKPLSFDRDEPEKGQTISGNNLESQSSLVEKTNVPLVYGNTSDIKNNGSNFVFFFGVSSSGKTVILSAILYYLRTQAGALQPKLGTENTKSAKVLLHDLTEKIKLGILPDRTTRDQVTRLDFEFIPNNKSKKVCPINMTFLEIAGGNHQDLSIGNGYHSSIDVFLKADIPLNVIIVTSYDKAERDDTLIYEFFDELINNGKSLKFVNVILVISKWDKSGRPEVLSESELESYIETYLPMTSQHLDTYGLNKAYFTIGEVINTPSGERIKRLNLATTQLLSNWLYESIVGFPLDYPGTFWEQIKRKFQWKLS